MQLVGVEVAVDALLASRGVVGEERSDAVSASFNIFDIRREFCALDVVFSKPARSKKNHDERCGARLQTHLGCRR